MTGDVREVSADDDDVVEGWIRATNDPERRVTAQLIRLPPGRNRPEEVRGWNVTVTVMEFIRKEPLSSELRSRITAALRAVDGVATANEMDTEVWWVAGVPTGPALVRAVAEVLDDFDSRIRANREHLGDPDSQA